MPESKYNPGKEEVGEEEARKDLESWLMGLTQPNAANQGAAKVFVDHFLSEVSGKIEKVREIAEIVIMNIENKDSTMGLRDALKVEDVNKLKEAASALAKTIDSHYEGNALTKAQVLQRTREALQQHGAEAVKVSDEPKGPRL